MRRAAAALLGGALLLAAAGLLLTRRGAAPIEGGRGARIVLPAAGSRERGELAHRDDVATALREAAAAAPRGWAPPDSLRDTAPDGALAADADGHLLINPELRRFFDYWYSASGEEPDARLRLRMVAAIRAQLDDPAEDEALALLERFVRYRQRGRELFERADLRDDLAARANAVGDLRRDVFGADDAARLFGDDDALVAVALAERRIAADPSLSAEQRVAQRAALEATLPERLRAVRAEAMAPQRLADEVAALRAQGASPAAIQALRASRVGEAAAERLAALDVQRAAWQQRVDTYRQARAAIDADPALDAAQRSAAVATLRAEHFSGPELQRIEALDSLEP
jgi:lipase chaperone LimK